MVFDRNEKKEVIALLGAGSMGTAIVRRIAAGRKVLLIMGCPFSGPSLCFSE